MLVQKNKTIGQFSSQDQLEKIVGDHKHLIVSEVTDASYLAVYSIEWYEDSGKYGFSFIAHFGKLKLAIAYVEFVEFDKMYTGADLVSFGEYLLSKEREDMIRLSSEREGALSFEESRLNVSHADIQNWRHSLISESKKVDVETQEMRSFKLAMEFIGAECHGSVFRKVVGVIGDQTVYKFWVDHGNLLEFESIPDLSADGKGREGQEMIENHLQLIGVIRMLDPRLV